VLSVRLDRLAVLPVRGVHWNDLGDPERVLATRRRARTMPVRERAAPGLDLGLNGLPVTIGRTPRGGGRV